MKYDEGKVRLSLVPMKALKGVMDVLEYGATKYEEEDWRTTENASVRYTDAAFRHIQAHMQGQKKDRESGLPHLAHAIADLMFVLESK